MWSISKAAARGAAGRVALVIGVLLSLLVLAAPEPAAAQASPVPIMAYYYIWFDTGSWERAKTDYPLLGRYSSDDRAVMEQHVRWAKDAGITGFIVSWKSTPKLNRRLAQLVEIANAENFKLSIIYQGLDFSRNPLPVSQIATDLDYFIEHYSNNKAFDMYPKPLVIWSGTWEFSASDIGSVTRDRRDRLLIAASEKNVEGYKRVAEVVDGDAYYWSSVDPDTFRAYQEKLDAMSAAVHAQHGLWIAPAASGFDARLIGGVRVVERNDGTTLRRQLDASIKSAPDMVGLISWNEFSENSHIEPSKQHGTKYLEVLADIRDGKVPEIQNIDSSDSGLSHTDSSAARIASLAGIVAVMLVSLLLVYRRHTQ